MTEPEILSSDSTALRKLDTLEVGRGLAAMAVVAHHAALSGDAFTSSSHARFFDFGVYGVDFFFVLSGFIIYYVHQRDPRNSFSARRFFRKRIRRIYTPYLPISAALIAAYLLVPSISEGNREWGWFSSLTLMPSNSPPALSVAWTLTFELVFYFVFLSFFATRHFWYIVFAWVSLTLGTTTFGAFDELSNALLRTILHPLILEFVAGMVAAHVFSKVSTAQWWVPLVLGLSCVLVFVFIHDAHRVFLGVSFAPIVLGFALLEHRYSVRISRPWVLLGASSYSLYLIHNPLQSVIARILETYDIWVLTFAAGTMISLMAGILYHQIYERPMLRILSQKVRQ